MGRVDLVQYHSRKGQPTSLPIIPGVTTIRFAVETLQRFKAAGQIQPVRRTFPEGSKRVLIQDLETPQQYTVQITVTSNGADVVFIPIDPKATHLVTNHTDGIIGEISIDPRLAPFHLDENSPYLAVTRRTRNRQGEKLDTMSEYFEYVPDQPVGKDVH